jgi:putative transposase
MGDRCRDLRWLFEAKKRFGFSVLDYLMTSNHIHLLVKDTGSNVLDTRRVTGSNLSKILI